MRWGVGRKCRRGRGRWGAFTRTGADNDGRGRTEADRGGRRDSVLTTGMRRDAESYFSSSVVDRPILDTTVTDYVTLLNANNYPKGAWVLHMLRGYIGDSGFFRGIREYYRRYRDSTALSDDFRSVMEDAAGRDLEWFFRQWLRQPGYPQLNVAWRPQGVGRVRLDVTQVQPARSEERRVGKECRSRWSPYHEKTKKGG